MKDANFAVRYDIARCCRMLSESVSRTLTTVLCFVADLPSSWFPSTDEDEEERIRVYGQRMSIAKALVATKTISFEELSILFNQ
jgi:hypothetical protein